MSWRLKPFNSLAPTGGRKLDTVRRVATHCFAYRPASCELDAKIINHGQGTELVRCEKSGEYFPNDRIVTQEDGRVVGVPYATKGPRSWQ
jgi:formylmethanofuran dehydrogenase subunit E